MAAKLTRLTHKMEIQLNLVTESSTIFSSSFRQAVRKLLDNLRMSLQPTIFTLSHHCHSMADILQHKCVIKDYER